MPAPRSPQISAQCLRSVKSPTPALVAPAAVGGGATATRTLDTAKPPERAGATEGTAALARGSLYVRAHWLRMPPLLLAYHLLIKAFRREQGTAH